MTAKNAGQMVASPGTPGQVAEFQDNPGKSGTVGKSDEHSSWRCGDVKERWAGSSEVAVGQDSGCAHPGLDGEVHLAIQLKLKVEPTVSYCIIIYN